jgi:hypothetical protein
MRSNIGSLAVHQPNYLIHQRAVAALPGLGANKALSARASGDTVCLSPEACRTSSSAAGLADRFAMAFDAGRPQAAPSHMPGPKLKTEGKFLKFDYFPQVENRSLEEKVEGAPNFRQVKGTQIMGAAQPTVSGIRNVLDRAGARDKSVMWTNMREEPVLYVNGRSVSLRDLKMPFENAHDFQGVSGKEIEATERRLKDEILAQAQKEPGRQVMITGEDHEGKLTKEWVKLDEASVRTPREIFDQLKKEGYKVDYERVPVTDEKAPEPKDLEALTKRVGTANSETPQIFNCHAGRGRTTTAMVVAQLIQDAQQRPAEGGPQTPFQRKPSVRQDIKEQGNGDRGEYKLILRTIRALDNGIESKAKTDQVLDRTQHMQNLRTDIAKLKYRSEDPTKDLASRQFARQRGQDYLHRYHTLITFQQYSQEQAGTGFQVPFSKWLESRPELGEMLKDLE